MLFPYRVRVSDPGMMQVLRILQKNRVAAIKNGNISKQIKADKTRYIFWYG